MVTPLIVEVPTTGPRPDRLARIAEQVRRNKASAQGPPVIAILGPLFRWLSRLGAYSMYMRHQRRLHTRVTHVRGPREEVHLASQPVRRAIPIGLAENGNLTVNFTVFSYARTLAISAIADSRSRSLWPIAQAGECRADDHDHRTGGNKGKGVLLS